jgi:hypothetical protein
VRKTERINQLEIELYKLRIELDLIHEIISTILSSQHQQDTSRMDSGKWYPRRMPPQN